MKKATELQKAMTVVKRALRKSKDYSHSWQANIAMSFSDEYYNTRKRLGKRCLGNADVHGAANRAAVSFLNLLTA